MAETDERKARLAQREATNKANAETLKTQKENQAKSNAEADKRMSQSKPTPTQDENDLAALGSPVLEKEDDGSGPDPHNQPLGAVAPVKRAAAADDHAASYKTRDAAAHKK